MAEIDPGQYTVKEMLSLIVIPRLDAIESGIRAKADADDLARIAKSVQDKADREEVRRLSEEVRSLSDKALTPEKIESQFAAMFQSAKARGWKTYERVVYAAGFGATVIGLITSIWVAIHVTHS